MSLHDSGSRPVGDVSCLRPSITAPRPCSSLPVISRPRSLFSFPVTPPPPKDPGFIGSAADEIRRLLDASRGRAFLLFTSFANLHAVRKELEPNLPFPLFVQ